MHSPFYSYVDKSGHVQPARNLAFEDVNRAFDEFLKLNNGRPTILAGHSQGTEHIARLIKERFENRDLKSQLVAAYLGGPPRRLNAKDNFPFIPIGKKPDDTGCYLTWNSISGKLSNRIKSIWPDHTDSPVVNPLSWDVNKSIISRAQNGGSIKFRGKKRRLYLEVTGAKCENGWVKVGPFKPNIFRFMISLGLKNHHLIDYNLFYESIYSNAILRVETFLKYQ